jgi:hypothetical protein
MVKLLNIWTVVILRTAIANSCVESKLLAATAHVSSRVVKVHVTLLKHIIVGYRVLFEFFISGG